MKILAISCSPRSNGNTVAMLAEVLAAAQEAGAEVELYSVAGKDIQPCDGCWTCVETGRCHKDDDTETLIGKMLAADGIRRDTASRRQPVSRSSNEARE